MKNDIPYLRLNRLRVLRRGNSVYDQQFHDGINIIRGQNGSGKSTISDFIFYILGGEFDEWKEAAKLCDEVQAEISTTNGELTLKRSISSKTSPISVYFGPMQTAQNKGIDSWETFPIRRQNGRESFSQIMFRSVSIPEAKSEGASNITMHQIMRLCYSDQRTPAPRLFRFESFDTPVIREAVGDLICGISGYEIYETELKLREQNKELDKIKNDLYGLLKALPADVALRTTDKIEAQLQELAHEKIKLIDEISNADKIVETGQIKQYLSERQQAQKDLSKLREKLESYEHDVNSLKLEILEIEAFQEYLQIALVKLTFAEASFNSIGEIAFTHCPSCGEELSPPASASHCNVCKIQAINKKDKSYYNKIRLDFEIQTRETKQLLLSKTKELESKQQSLREVEQNHSKELSNFEMKYSGGNGPREAFLATRTNRIGHIDAELNFLTRSLGLAIEIDSLNTKKLNLEESNEKLTQRKNALQRQAQTRRSLALSEISNIGVSLLHQDLDGRQEEFKKAELMEISFRDDAIFVDEKLNFAESSNVFLKNTAILSMLLAAGGDNAFFHPRFLLLDNIEDKGMEVARSHLFQEMIVKYATELEVPYQVIFTTSMMNPKLELQEYTIGPHYSKNERSLKL